MISVAASQARCYGVKGASKKSVGWHYVNTIGLAKKSVRVFYYIVWKNPNELLDQANILFSHLFCALNGYVIFPFCVEKHPERDHFFQKVFVINKLDGQAYKVKILLTIKGFHLHFYFPC